MIVPKLWSMDISNYILNTDNTTLLFKLFKYSLILEGTQPDTFNKQ